MWSDRTRRATRVSPETRVSNFWDGTPVPHGDAPAPQTQLQPPATSGAAQDQSSRSFAELEREAFTKGYAQGERAGAEASARRGEATLRRLAQTIEELAGLRGDLVQKTERQVVELALAIARRILHSEVTLDRELLVAMARVAIERLGEHTSATIRLNPDDYASIGGVNCDSGIVRVVADPLVASGGCLVQSDFGLIDVSLDAQLGEMAAALGLDKTSDDGDARLTRGAA